MYLEIITTILLLILIVGMIKPSIILKRSKRPARIKIFIFWLVSSFLIGIAMSFGGSIHNHLSPKYISKNEAIEDIYYFVKTAEQIHVDLYHTISKDRFHFFVRQLQKSIPDSISVAEFSKKMRVLVGRLNDGHTNVFFAKELIDNYKKEKCVLPFMIRIENDKIIIKESNSDKLSMGDELVSINGIKTHELLKLIQYASADNEANKIKRLEKYFPYYFYIEYNLRDSVHIRIIRNGKALNKNVLLTKRMGNRGATKYSYKTIDSSIALLRINTFWGIDRNRYISFLDSSFKKIKDENIHSLVIDVSKNRGGNSDYGALILPYINVLKYKFVQKYQIKTSKPEKKYFRKMFIKWYMYPLYPLAFLSENGRVYLFKKNGTVNDVSVGVEKLKPVVNAYQGPVFIFTSNETYSAAADFVSAFVYAKRGKVIGDTVGQPYSGFIDAIPVILPHSKLQAMVSYKKYEYVGANETNTQRGMAPDIYFNVDAIKSETELDNKLIAIIHTADKKYSTLCRQAGLKVSRENPFAAHSLFGYMRSRISFNIISKRTRVWN